MFEIEKIARVFADDTIGLQAKIAMIESGAVSPDEAIQALKSIY
jgi:hypothetical protein